MCLTVGDVVSATRHDNGARNAIETSLKLTVETLEMLRMLLVTILVQEMRLKIFWSIHPFSSLLSMLGSHRDQWEACVAAWRFVHCLAIVKGGKTTDARGSSSSPLRPRKAPKCVRREYVLSVSLRFHGFCAWQNRNCQSEYCLSRRDLFCNRKLDMSFSEADRMELDSTYSSSRKWDFLPGSFREGRRFDWRSMAIYRFVMTWKKV